MESIWLRLRFGRPKTSRHNVQSRPRKGAISRALNSAICNLTASLSPHPKTPATSATSTDALTSAAPWLRFAGCVRGLPRSSGRLLRSVLAAVSETEAHLDDLFLGDARQDGS